MSIGRGLILALAVVGALTSSGCSPFTEDRPLTDPPSPSAPAAAPARPLGPDWYQDPDRDFIPTAVEIGMGTDPAVDECARSIDCPGISEESGLVRPEQVESTMMILDSSGSMRGTAGGNERKIDVAEQAIERFATGTPDRFNLGLVVYGHVGSSAEADKERSCEGVEVAAELGEVDYRTLPRVLDRYDPRGYTPVARSIQEAGRAFVGREDEVNRVVLVTDGLETCDGDPVAAARRLKESGVNVTVDVVGFDISKSADAEGLREIAEASGGEYTDARTARDLEAFVEAENRRIQELNEAQSCLSGRGNELYSCYSSQSNGAYSNMSNRSNAVYSELSNRSNAIYSDYSNRANAIYSELSRQANEADSAGDDAGADEIRADRDRQTSELRRRRDQLTSELRTRRDRVTSEVRLLRDRVTSSIRSERDRARIENEALKDKIRLESDEVRRRLRQRYGQAGLRSTGTFVCLPRVFRVAPPPRLQ